MSQDGEERDKSRFSRDPGSNMRETTFTTIFSGREGKLALIDIFENK